MQKNMKGWMLAVLATMTMLMSGAAVAQSSSSSSSSSKPATLPPLPPGYIVCASQGEICSFTGTRTVLIDSCFEYTCWSSKVVGTGSVACQGYLSMGFARCAYSVTQSSSSSMPSTPPLVLSAKASNQSGASRSAVKAIDGDLVSRWEASNSSVGNWLQVGSGDPFYISKIQITEYGSRIRGYRVEYLDGAVWVPLAEGASLGTLTINRQGSPLVMTYAVRIITTTPSAGQPSIAEFVLTATPVPRP